MLSQLTLTDCLDPLSPRAAVPVKLIFLKRIEMSIFHYVNLD